MRYQTMVAADRAGRRAGPNEVNAEAWDAGGLVRGGLLPRTQTLGGVHGHFRDESAICLAATRGSLGSSHADRRQQRRLRLSRRTRLATSTCHATRLDFTPNDLVLLSTASTIEGHGEETATARNDNLPELELGAEGQRNDPSVEGGCASGRSGIRVLSSSRRAADDHGRRRGAPPGGTQHGKTENNTGAGQRRVVAFELGLPPPPHRQRRRDAAPVSGSG